NASRQSPNDLSGCIRSVPIAWLIVCSAAVSGPAPGCTSKCGFLCETSPYGPDEQATIVQTLTAQRSARMPLNSIRCEVYGVNDWLCCDATKKFATITRGHVRCKGEACQREPKVSGTNGRLVVTRRRGGW